jgi:Trk-type K+ transport system membrane component
VSAFNNAGISLAPDSFTGFAGDPVIVITVTLAFIIGGLGFPVLLELRRRTPYRRWSLHARLTILATAVFLVAGPLAVAAFEWTNPDTLGALSTGDTLLGAWFQGTTPRTAGFNTFEIGDANPSTHLVMTVLMFIGAGPASTSGGIKITTFAMLGYVLWTEVRGDQEVMLFRRRIPAPVIRQALGVVLLSIAAVMVPTIGLLAVADVEIGAALFEATSAFGTVGLTTGITPTLPTSGHLMLVIVMLAGRVGPLTMATALAMRQRPRRYHYPEERPIIG